MSGISGTTARIPIIEVTVMGGRFGRVSKSRVGLGKGTAEPAAAYPMNEEATSRVIGDRSRIADGVYLCSLSDEKPHCCYGASDRSRNSEVREST